MPPGVFVTLAFCIAAVKLIKSRKQAALWAAFAVLLWGASLNPVGKAALSGLEYAYLPPSEVKADAVVILSAGIQEGAPQPFGCAALSGVSVERAAEAARLYRKYNLPLVITGGAAFSRGSEAGAIKQYLVSLGVPENRMLTEERARDTSENALFSKRLCDEKGYRRIVLVTSAYHMRRSVWAFEKAGFRDIVPWPVGYSSATGGQTCWMDCLPGSYDLLRRAAQERLGLLYYRLLM